MGPVMLSGQGTQEERREVPTSKEARGKVRTMELPHWEETDA